MILITGASNNHFLTLLNMINSFIKHTRTHTLIIYNLGIDNNKWRYIEEQYKNNNFHFKIFDYSKYPSWFNINIEAGQYAWKPVIIYDTFLEFKNEIIVWMDAGNLIHDNLNLLEEYIKKNNIHSTLSSGLIKDWTHPKTIEYLKCDYIEEINRNGACLGFNTKIEYIKELLEEYYNYAQDRSCIAPEGSSRVNHRQDQAVFTILFYKYLKKYNPNYDYTNSETRYGYSIHHDID
jgi:hypothetical protein